MNEQKYTRQINLKIRFYLLMYIKKLRRSKVSNYYTPFTICMRIKVLMSMTNIMSMTNNS